jgi:DHA1 family multidrug resistance protein-like MFS transporter
MGGLIAESFGYRQSFWITGSLLGMAGLGVVFLVQEDFVPPAKEQRVGFLGKLPRPVCCARHERVVWADVFCAAWGLRLTVRRSWRSMCSALNGGRQEGAAALTGLVIGAAALTSAISAVYLGRLGDRIGHTKVLIGSALAAMVFYAPQTVRAVGFPVDLVAGA